MQSFDPEFEPSRPSIVGRWVLWVPALALAFYLGSISRGQLGGEGFAAEPASNPSDAVARNAVPGPGLTIGWLSHSVRLNRFERSAHGNAQMPKALGRERVRRYHDDREAP